MNKNGFTLIEIILGIGLLSILYTILFPFISNSIKSYNKIEKASYLTEKLTGTSEIINESIENSNDIIVNEDGNRVEIENSEEQFVLEIKFSGEDIEYQNETYKLGDLILDGDVLIRDNFAVNISDNKQKTFDYNTTEGGIFFSHLIIIDNMQKEDLMNITLVK